MEWQCSGYHWVHTIAIYHGGFFSVLIVLAEVHWQAGLGFLSPNLLTRTHLHHIVEKPWSSLYMLPSNFFSTVWYLASACANLWDCFLVFCPCGLYHTVCSFAVSGLVSSTSSSVSNYPAFSTSAANNFALSSPELLTPRFPSAPPWATSPSLLLLQILWPEPVTPHTCILPVKLQYISLLHYSLPCFPLLGPTIPTICNRIIWPSIRQQSQQECLKLKL